MVDEIAILLSAALIVTVIVALFSKSVSISLIALFYSSIIIGVVFTLYGDTLLGLIEVVTFAGAISVLLLSVIMMTAESKFDIGAKRLGLSMAAALVVLIAAALFRTATIAGSSPVSEDVSLNVFSFLWANRPWDLLILVTVFASSMVTVVNLFSKQRGAE